MSQALKDRTKKFAIDVWLLCSKIPHSREFNNYVNQLLRCSSSIAANYRAAMRAKSNADFINKLKIVEEEADENEFFLELLQKFNQDSSLDDDFVRLNKEINELISIFVASLKTARSKYR
ncbi:four helix bundle protein [Algoriphagus lacus]|uniref:Four helix bundle protein n=1 Tax=Algoriphagus lacus TaxID=2056311 RepID=A0A418PLY7_9BACT|nr:four helix bundle protein [Algoriphagus lacus]RIW12530.1 four helix bundle protein [Algoriphagus lacus]